MFMLSLEGQLTNEWAQPLGDLENTAVVKNIFRVMIETSCITNKLFKIVSWNHIV